MVLWGGAAGSWLNDGRRYNPTSNTWAGVSSTSLSPRDAFPSIWTGNEMIIWGGYYISASAGSGTSYTLASGGRHDPSANAWASMTTNGAPSARSNPSAAWQGSQLHVWDGPNDTYSYSPQRLMQLYVRP